MRPRVTINLCTYNRTGEAFGLLTSLQMQTYKDWDLVIVDDSEHPIANQKYIADLLNRMQFEGHNVKYIHNPVRQGVAKARNQAVENSDTEFILRVDDDGWMEPRYLEKLVVLCAADEKTGAVGGIVPTAGVPEQWRNVDVLNGVFNRVVLSDNDIVLADDGGYSWDQAAILPSHHLRSSYVFRKSAWEKVKGFPLEYGFVGFREETDFCLRLIMAGYKLYTDTTARNWHGRCATGGCRSPDYAQQVGLCDYQFKRKFLRYRKQGKLTEEMLHG